MQARFMIFAAVAGFLGVAMGAFGAHGLKNVLSEHYLDIYKTAVSYQMWHALLLALIATLPRQKFLTWAGWALVTGIVLFSGSLYLLAILNIGWLGMITPLGGLAFLLAWGLLAYAAFLHQRNSTHG
ncbi:MAG: DUF423 domain-containing protein [Methylomonas sp.]|jgi:uncharacterized membrane protein YgdD (TMEM256/DUF423 family)|uniref:DUF423 domain-containing protein n=1 Tax=Methylomonas sp. TaxID=418 RepID=UPI0025FE3701|nr:DUF423 domain-containing protein [Methylomonas sp.]MCK9606563.1 DUF423 domain-containing protein [Methylomonas sp.]